MRRDQLARFSSLAYERRSGLIPICHAWVRSYGLGPVRRRLLKQPERTYRLRLVFRSLGFGGPQVPVARYFGFTTSVEPKSPPLVVAKPKRSDVRRSLQGGNASRLQLGSRFEGKVQ